MMNEFVEQQLPALWDTCQGGEGHGKDHSVMANTFSDNPAG